MSLRLRKGEPFVMLDTEEHTMRVFAVHDETGNIVGLAIPAEGVENGQFGVIAEAGQYVSEIELHDKKQPNELLSDLARNYRVERLATSARFVEKHKPGR